MFVSLVYLFKSDLCFILWINLLKRIGKKVKIFIWVQLLRIIPLNKVQEKKNKGTASYESFSWRKPSCRRQPWEQANRSLWLRTGEYGDLHRNKCWTYFLFIATIRWKNTVIINILLPKKNQKQSSIYSCAALLFLSRRMLILFYSPT